MVRAFVLYRGDRVLIPSQGAGIFSAMLYTCYGNHVVRLTNIEGPDEMMHYAAFHLGLHYLQKYQFRGFIWVFTVCKSTSLEVSSLQRVKEPPDPL